MPTALEADWGLIQQLYIQGFTPKAISDKTGVKADTVSIRAHRGKWKELAARAIEAVKCQPEVVQVKSSNTRKLEAQSEHVRAGLADVLKRQIDEVTKLSITGGRSAISLASELEPLVRSAKTVFAWGEALAQPAIRIQVVAQCRLASEPVPSQGQGTGLVHGAKESILLAGPEGTGPRGVEPLSGGGVVVDKPTHHFPTFEKAPVLDVASEIVSPVAEDYCI